MDHRTESFARRFSKAIPHLRARAVQDVVSLKYRDNTVGSQEYNRFIDDFLVQVAGLDIAELYNDFGEPAWSVRDNLGNSVILVEHETGLEILYIAGSLASLVGLIPLITAGWERFRNRRHPYPDRPDVGNIEVRRMDDRNILIEQHIQNTQVYLFNEAVRDYEALRQKVDSLEAQLRNLETEPAKSKKPSHTTVPSRKKKNKKRKR